MAKMKAAVVTKAGSDFEIQEREIPQPGAGQVRIRVHACGICFSDHYVKDGFWPGLTFPRTPGHEVAGTIDEVGAGLTTWKKRQRVGVGWHGGQDGTCISCRRGDFGNCVAGKITGFTYDGGYAEYMVAPVEAVASMPESLDPAEAAPLLCAGITTFNASRHSGAMPGDLVAGADLTDATLVDADLTNADLRGVHWEHIAGIKNANIFGVKNTPRGFLEGAMKHGALQRDTGTREPG
jgi:D-arabinose 1-dehydrogenase-like Zn-dependent alcohol dehydrogenase